eukprot:scaffold395640_cov96-Cyclotella_meneghiniana.AAC.1
MRWKGHYGGSQSWKSLEVTSHCDNQAGINKVQRPTYGPGEVTGSEYGCNPGNPRVIVTWSYTTIKTLCFTMSHCVPSSPLGLR